MLLGHPNTGGARSGQPPLSSASQSVRMKLYFLVPALVCVAQLILRSEEKEESRQYLCIGCEPGAAPGNSQTFSLK